MKKLYLLLGLIPLISLSFTLAQNKPVLDPITAQNTNEGDTLNVAVSATDLDGDPITLTAENLPAFTGFVDNGNGTGTITFTPGFTEAGIYTNIEVIATDDEVPAHADTTTFDLTVNDVNRAPLLDPISAQNMNEGDTLGVAVSSTDADGDNIILTTSGLPAFANFLDNGDGTGTITLTPGYTDNGVYANISLIATDDGTPVNADTTTFTLTVNDVNGPPLIGQITAQNVNEGDTLGVAVNSTDPDGDNITLTTVNLPPFASFIDKGDGTGTITFTPGYTDNSVYTDIKVIATDDGTPALTDTSSFTLTVGDVNRAPVVDPIAAQ
ncbi:MAG: Ig-like domain-containing protein, partial [Ignavibacteriaceae bacterium]